MKILHFTTDLMLGSQVSQAARARGATVQMVNRLEPLFEQIDDTTALIILDLQSGNWSANDFGERFKNPTDFPPVVAYAQHVHEDLLAEAHRVGIEAVLTRGQFTREVNRLLDSHVANRSS